MKTHLFLPISTFSALGVFHVMRYINVRYLLTLPVLTFYICNDLHMIRVTHYGVVAAKPRVSHFVRIVFVYPVGKTMRRIENRLTPLVIVAAYFQ